MCFFLRTCASFLPVLRNIRIFECSWTFSFIWHFDVYMFYSAISIVLSTCTVHSTSTSPYIEYQSDVLFGHFGPYSHNRKKNYECLRINYILDISHKPNILAKIDQATLSSTSDSILFWWKSTNPFTFPF